MKINAPSTIEPCTLYNMITMNQVEFVRGLLFQCVYFILFLYSLLSTRKADKIMSEYNDDLSIT